MSTVGFYAPQKPPDDPVPSGDRALARALIKALEAGGVRVDLASRLSSRDGAGDVAAQSALHRAAQDALPGIIATGKRAGWRAWITYHSYYKAPDLLGRHAAQALGIPYLLIEATRAAKRLTGPWASFAAEAEAACDAAQVIFYLTERDAIALRAAQRGGQHILPLPPFLPRRDLPAASTGGPMLAAGMMRYGDKLGSYQIIAEVLHELAGDWRLDIAGDGPARADVAALMAPFGPRVRLLGALDADGMERAYGSAALLLWPGVNEAVGLACLEAQAYGLPVVAQDRPGLRDVLYPRPYPAPEEGAAALAAFLRQTLDTPPAAEAIRAHVAAHHLLPAAQGRLIDALRKVETL